MTAADTDSAVAHLSESETIADHVEEHSPVIVDFHAEWCGPCKQMEPVLEAVAAATPASVLKIDVDEHQELAGEHGVRGVPTLLIYHRGEPAERLVGFQSEAALRDVVSQYT